MSQRDQNGMTLVELVAVVAMASLVLTGTLLVSVPLMARETLRSAAHDASSFAQLAKIEAASRSIPCLFALDADAGTLSVWDSQGTTTRADDLLLHEGPLPTSIGFARPGGGSAVTLGSLGAGHLFGAMFAPNGSVSFGAGDVYFAGGDSFARMSLFVGGGVEILFWDGTEWRVGA